MGLDYPAVIAVGRIVGVDVRRPRVLRGLQALERETLRRQAVRADVGGK